MLTPYQEMLLTDVGAPNGYGTPLAGWKDEQRFFGGPPDPAPLKTLSPDLAQTFVDRVYTLLRTKRKIRERYVNHRDSRHASECWLS